MLVVTTLQSWIKAFQSAPGCEAGRCAQQAHREGRFAGFNPRPAVRPGDADFAFTSIRSRISFQSAPGCEAGRCLPCDRITSSQSRFNPRPAVRPGDATKSDQIAFNHNVSIRARL